MRQSLERAVNGGVGLGKTKSYDRFHRIVLIERRYRNRRYLLLDDDALAKFLIGLVETERREIDVQKIRALRLKDRKADACQAIRQTVTAACQLRAHIGEKNIRLAHP